jgi:hypothetical protein
MMYGVLKRGSTANAWLEVPVDGKKGKVADVGAAK